MKFALSFTGVFLVFSQVLPQGAYAGLSDSSFLVKKGQTHIIRTTHEERGDCYYLTLEQCSLNSGPYRAVSDLTESNLKCSPLLPHIEAISTASLDGVVNNEYAKFGLKGLATPVAGAAAAGVGVLMYFAGAEGAISTGVGVAIFGAAVVAPVVASTAGLTDKVVPVLRYINPFFNGAVVKTLRAPKGSPTELGDPEALIRQADAIEGSLGDLSGSVESAETGAAACPAEILR